MDAIRAVAPTSAPSSQDRIPQTSPASGVGEPVDHGTRRIRQLRVVAALLAADWAWLASRRRCRRYKDEDYWRLGSRATGYFWCHISIGRCNFMARSFPVGRRCLAGEALTQLIWVGTREIMVRSGQMDDHQRQCRSARQDGERQAKPPTCAGRLHGCPGKEPLCRRARSQRHWSDNQPSATSLRRLLVRPEPATSTWHAVMSRLMRWHLVAEHTTTGTVCGDSRCRAHTDISTRQRVKTSTRGCRRRPGDWLLARLALSRLSLTATGPPARCCGSHRGNPSFMAQRR